MEYDLPFDKILVKYLECANENAPLFSVISILTKVFCQFCRESDSDFMENIFKCLKFVSSSNYLKLK